MYYMFGIPTALILGFYFAFGLHGLWLGYITAMACLNVVVGYIVVYKSTWTANFVVSPKSPKSLKRLQEEQQKILMEE